MDQPEPGAGILYIIATPIGNLEDITYRAVRLLREVDLVAAEDTRHSRKLFAHYQITTPLLSYHEHNEQQRHDELLERLATGEQIALISDAGTPGIADPGYRLSRVCHEAGFKVVPVPGPSAVITALSVAGVPTDRFAFEGYLPSRAKARQDLLQALKDEPRTLVFYETPHRLLASLEDLADCFGNDQGLVVARELTKLHEELYRGTVEEAHAHFSGQKVRGEIVLILAPRDRAPQVSMREALRRLLSDSELTRKQAVKLVAKEYGRPGSDVYRESLTLMEERDPDEQEG